MTISQDWAGLAGRLDATLHPTAPPVAITFSDEAPAGIPAFDDPMPAPSPDGRTGRVPAGCVFWMKSLDRTFTTEAADHANCSVGSLTHGFISMEEAATKGDVAALLDSGWVTMDMVPQIPLVSQKPGAVTYGPLTETPIDPDVVLLRLSARALMVLSDALPGLRIEGKPQCHIVAAAKEHGDVVASVGCALSRVRTGMPATDNTCAVPASRLSEVVEALERTAATDSIVAKYAAEDARRFA
ncbi:MAG TPA: DUF169 domain-containing protein [Acidimicrobiales bacterium]